MYDTPRFEPYIQKLERGMPLSQKAREALRIMPVKVDRLAANEEFIRQGDKLSYCSLVSDGFVCKYRTFKDGSRQIFSIHVPGDMVNLQSVLGGLADYGAKTNTPTTLVLIDHKDLLELAELHPEILRAFWFDTLTDAAIFREWSVNVGSRGATARTAHLILEIADKMKSAGLNQDNTFSFPISQSDLADAVGVTPVHINRVLQKLRGDRLILTHMRTMTIEDEDALRAIAGFNPMYLHSEGARYI